MSPPTNNFFFIVNTTYTFGFFLSSCTFLTSDSDLYNLKFINYNQINILIDNYLKYMLFSLMVYNFFTNQNEEHESL